METVLYCLGTLALGFFLGRKLRHGYSFQNDSEARLSHALQENFRPPDYHLMNHITLQLSDGTTQIDHILVSRFGVFVIETKDYSGWIFANAQQATWTQVLFHWKFRFQNPLRQNHRHVLAVQARLDFLPVECIQSIVVFTGEAQFKTEVPHGVFSLSGLISHLYQQKTELLSLNRVQFCVGRLETARLAITGATDVEHIEGLKRRHRDNR